MRTPKNPVGDWAEYFAACLDKPIHPLYRVLEPHLPALGTAIDLGCGVGTGVRWLLDRGWHVTAVDIQDEPLQMLAARVPHAQRERLEIWHRDIAGIDLTGFDLVFAGFSLFFLIKSELDDLWQGIPALFAGELLGERDDWAREGYVSHSRQEVEAMLEGFDVLHLEEAERDGATAQGTPKHWHVFHIIARRRSETSDAARS